MFLQNKTLDKTVQKKCYKILDSILNSGKPNSKVLNKLNQKNQSILQLAIENNHMNITEEIIKNYYLDYEQPDGNGNLPIHLAANNGSLKVFDILSKYKAISTTPNIKNENPLHLAAAKNRFAFIEKFMKYENSYMAEMADKGVDIVPCVKQRNELSYTPLFTALLADHMKSIELLSASDDVECEATDKAGNSLFHICAQLNSVEPLRLLLKNSKFIQTIFIKNDFQETPLHFAGKTGNIDIFKLILGKFYDGKLILDLIYIQDCLIHI